jgi:membrane-associated protease RseP (regulator of RpoE activity)
MKWATAIVLAVLWSGSSIAAPGQLNTQPNVFYGEEPWGGSYLGVDTQDITSDRLGALHLKEERGVEVTMVDQDAPAGKAGLKEHDVILSINEQQVQSVEQLRRLIRETPPGRTVSIGISRDGRPMALKAQLVQRSKGPDMDFNFNPAINVPPVHIPPINIPEIDVPNIVVVHAPRSSGMMIENLTPQLGEFFGVKGGNGVLVRSVEKGSRAEQAGIHAGDVIVKINGSAVNDCSDFTRLLRARTSAKAAVTILRDRKEQVLTLSLPEPKRTGSQDGSCEDWLTEAACGEMQNGMAEAALLMPALRDDLEQLQPDVEKLKKQIQDEILKQQPEMEKMKKQLQKEILNRESEWKREMAKLQHDLERQKHEWTKELHQWQKRAAEI